MGYKAIKTSPKDNVAIVVQPIPKGGVVTVPDSGEVMSNQEIPLGHKIALVPITKGANVIRYGEVICVAAEDIKPGDWVHMHNTTIE
ncbi:UxaA family hydrolase [Chloroflexota bacterium]